MEAAALALQTTYADLLDKLLDESIRAAPSEDGSFVAKLIKGKRYWYRQAADAQGVQRQHYAGPETPDLLERMARHKAMLETARSRRDLVRALTGSGAFIPPVSQVGKVLEALAISGVFRLRAVLVGTAAFACYGPMLGIRLRSANLLTSDIDIAQFRSISIAVEDALPPVTDALRRVDPGFEPLTLPLHDRQPVSYITRGGGRADPLKVEFLTPMRGPVEDAPAHLPALQTSAQPLRFLDYLIYGEQPAAYLYGSGVLVNVPHPARYAWHKCIVAERRAMPEKVRKDLLQAEPLFDALASERPHDVRDMWDDLAGPGRTHWQAIARGGLAKIAPGVRTRVEALIGP